MSNESIVHMAVAEGIFLGDSFEELKALPDDCINLIVTSPPYADQRKATYGGVHPDNYVEWFLPLAEQMLRVLRPDGSLIINIKEKTVDGERHVYVLNLILKMRELGWKWTEEYMWHKRNSFPGKWPNRLRDAWERCLHFTKNKKFAMYQDAVKVPIGGWAETRMKKLSANDRKRMNASNGSGFGKNIEKWVGKEMVLPDNVLYFATECSNTGHSASYPAALPEFFIKLFSKKGDIVLDPFLGSGTTAVVAKDLKRQYIGYEIKPEFYKIAQERIEKTDAVIDVASESVNETYIEL